jgi:hypothetical protein
MRSALRLRATILSAGAIIPWKITDRACCSMCGYGAAQSDDQVNAKSFVVRFCLISLCAPKGYLSLRIGLISSDKFQL